MQSPQPLQSSSSIYRGFLRIRTRKSPTSPSIPITSVQVDSPAAKAGLREGDVIMRVNGAAVGNLQEFSNILRSLSPGQRVAVVLRRGAEDVNVDVTLAER